MKHLHIGRTDTSPQIDIDAEHGLLEFTGRSLPTNSEQFFARVHGCLDEYLRNQKPLTTVNMRLDYLDTSSSKHFYNILGRLGSAMDQGKQVKVNWHYEEGDEQMEEAGRDFETLLRMPFAFIREQELF
jgi:SiaC family regulatory phosphoprotein